jgi:hypothetical protein
MKLPIPSLRNIERIVRMVPLVKDILPNSDNSNLELLRLIKKVKEQDTALYAKKNEIVILENKIKDLEQVLSITEELRTEAEVKLGQAGGI